MPKPRLPLHRKIRWGDLTPSGGVPDGCVWKPQQVLAGLIEARQAGESHSAAAWPVAYLRAFPGELAVLGLYIGTVADGASFKAACQRRGWSRATAYRFRDRALRIIAIGLARDCVAQQASGGKVGKSPTKIAEKNRKTSHATSGLEHVIDTVVA